MTEREALQDYFGDPEAQEFKLEEFLGRYGGMINLIGLQHKGLVAPGSRLFQILNATYGGELRRWAFLFELSDWCARFTKTQNESRTVGKKRSYTIEKGALLVGSTRYFCVPQREEIRCSISAQS